MKAVSLKQSQASVDTGAFLLGCQHFPVPLAKAPVLLPVAWEEQWLQPSRLFPFHQQGSTCPMGHPSLFRSCLSQQAQGKQEPSRILPVCSQAPPPEMECL